MNNDPLLVNFSESVEENKNKREEKAEIEKEEILSKKGSPIDPFQIPPIPEPAPFGTAKRGMGFWPAFIIIVAVLLIAGGGVYYFLSKGEEVNIAISNEPANINTNVAVQKNIQTNQPSVLPVDVPETKVMSFEELQEIQTKHLMLSLGSSTSAVYVISGPFAISRADLPLKINIITSMPLEETGTANGTSTRNSSTPGNPVSTMNTVDVKIDSIIDKSGKNIFDNESMFEGDPFFTRVSLNQNDKPVNHLTGTRALNILKDSLAKDIVEIKGSIVVSIPNKVKSVKYSDAELNKLPVTTDKYLSVFSFADKNVVLKVNGDLKNMVSIKVFDVAGKEMKATAVKNMIQGFDYTYGNSINSLELVYTGSTTDKTYAFDLNFAK
ncbi:MAG: hypothetical protein NTV72_01500 [Candidatus Taylorbacteria bacterium]|nr:hypothetical protein [Candidatus Taylorbacteria bacterium]